MYSAPALFLFPGLARQSKSLRQDQFLTLLTSLRPVSLTEEAETESLTFMNWLTRPSSPTCPTRTAHHTTPHHTHHEMQWTEGGKTDTTFCCKYFDLL